MRESWTDARLDAFVAHTDRRFDTLERRVDNGFNRVDARFERVESRIDDLHRTLLQLGGGAIATLVVGFLGVIVTQL